MTACCEYAGARPTDRDAVDKRIVANVKARAAVESSIAWPVERHHPLQQERRRLAVVPAEPPYAHVARQPVGIASNGYSNLENWLHSSSSLVCRQMVAESPARPLSLSVQ